MEDRSHALIAIAFLILFGVGAALVTWWMLAPAVSRVPYLLVSHASVAGLGPGSPVNYEGVQVGAVRKVELNPGNREVDVIIGVDKDFALPKGTFAIIASQGLIGNKAIELKLGKSKEMIATSASSAARMPLKEGSLAGLMAQASDIVAELKTTLQSVQQLLSQDNQRRLTNTLAHVEEASARLAALEKAAEPTVKELPDLLARTRGALASVHRLLGDADRLVAAAHAPVRAVGRAASSAGAVLARLDQITAPQLDALLIRLRALSAHLERLAAQLQQAPQSLVLGAPPAQAGPGETRPRPGQGG